MWVFVALRNTALPELLFNTALIGDVFMLAEVCMFDLYRIHYVMIMSVCALSGWSYCKQELTFRKDEATLLPVIMSQVWRT